MLMPGRQSYDLAGLAAERPGQLGQRPHPLGRARPGRDEGHACQPVVERVRVRQQAALAEVLAVVGGDDDQRLVEHPLPVERLQHAGQPVVRVAHRAGVEPAHALQRAVGDVERPEARPPDRVEVEVAARLVGGSGAPECTHAAVGPRWQVGRVALDEVHEPERPLAVPLIDPAAHDLGRLRGAVVVAGAHAVGHPGQAVAQAVLVQARLAVSLHAGEPLEAGVEPGRLRDPDVGAHGARRPARAAQDLGQQAVGEPAHHGPGAQRRAVGRLRQADRARQHAGQHRHVRGQRPARGREDVAQCTATPGQVGDRRARPRGRAVGLQCVGPRGVEHDDQDVQRGTIPSTKGTSSTFSWHTGPCPKNRSSPNSSPWSLVTITQVLSGSASNSRAKTPSR